jgi:Bifunctional DNA primase/polymerase, N-terminal
VRLNACITEWAAEYRSRALAICRLKPGEKRPTYKGWNRASLEPGDFGPADSIGIISGRLSGDLVCIDIDCREALAEADRYLPATRMEEGRKGKPRSHRWFKVTDIPPEWTATATCAGGMGGPRTTQFARGRQAGSMVVEFRGTGGQAVAPASVWTSPDGTRQERRVWHSFAEPAVLGYMELLGAVARFASAFGGRNSRWEAATRPRASRRRVKRERPAPVPGDLPTGEVAQKARAYLRKVRPAVQGEAGDRHTFSVACVLVRDFALPVEEALPLLEEWNETCLPPWTDEELIHKLEEADALEGPRGTKLRSKSSRIIDVCIRPGDREVLVGVDCAKADVSYVNLSPDLWAGMVRHEHTFRLAPKLDALDWTDKVVMLATPSNVATNKKLVYDEFKLAYLLGKRGADVRCLRIDSPNGRRVTLSQAEHVEVTTPPLTAREAQVAAQAASRNARERAAARRSQPRKKASAKMEQAMAWLKKQNAEQVTKALARKARKRGLTERTLYRALEEMRQNKEKT